MFLAPLLHEVLVRFSRPSCTVVTLKNVHDARIDTAHIGKKTLPEHTPWLPARHCAKHWLTSLGASRYRHRHNNYEYEWAELREGISNVAMNAWLPRAGYPCGNFSDTSS